jgi:hypothetical protein
MSSSHGAEICVGPGKALPLTDLNSMKYVTLKVLTAGTIKIIAFWDMLACTSVNSYQHCIVIIFKILALLEKRNLSNRLSTACRYQGKLDKFPFPLPVYMQ